MFFFSADSTYDIATETVTLPLGALPAPYAITPALPSNAIDTRYTVAQSISQSGSYIQLTKHSIALSIPENAIPSKKLDVYLSVLAEDRFRPNFPDGFTQLSPVIYCAPDTVFRKPVVLKFPHCACLEQNCWEISVFENTPPSTDWRQSVTLGQETINTPVYAQLDPDCVYWMADGLTKIVLAGRSIHGMSAFKKLKLLVYAPLNCIQTQIDFNIRVYVLEDLDTAMQIVHNMEKKNGGRLLDKPKSFLFQDNGSNLCLSLSEISDGWKVKPCSNYQEIPFKHVWNSSSNSLHCSFTIEQVELYKNLKFKINATQTNSTHQQLFDIYATPGFSSSLEKRDLDRDVFESPLRNTRDSHTNLLSNARDISFDSPMKPNNATKVTFESSSLRSLQRDNLGNYDNNSIGSKSVMVTDRGVSTVEDIPFKLNKSIKKQLCKCLDPPNNCMNDWRMLAKALSVDRYINYFATKASPTEHILDLWECRNRQGSALTELVSIFRAMGRSDAVSIIEKSLGPSWL